MTNTNPGSSGPGGWGQHARGRVTRILLAEDDHEMRQWLEAELRSDGYAVAVARDGTELLEALSEVSRLSFAVPDIILMDVRMPGYSGLHVLAAVRAAGWKTPVIIMTAFGDPRLHEEAARLGANVVFDKPFDLDDLRTALLHVAETPRSEGTPGPETPGRGG